MSWNYFNLGDSYVCQIISCQRIERRDGFG
jgi:hypothetical protein